MAIVNISYLGSNATSSVNGPSGSDPENAQQGLRAPRCEGGCGCSCCSKGGVRPDDAEVQLPATDISAGGFGGMLSHERVYSNRLPVPTDIGQGNGWLISNMPYLQKDSAGNIAFVRNTHDLL